MSTKSIRKTVRPSLDHVLFELFISVVGCVSPLQAVVFLLKDQNILPRTSRLSSAERLRARKTFFYLLSHKYITYVEQHGAIVLQLTPKGRKKAQAEGFRNALEPISGTSRGAWDGKWRLILFDIPATDRVKRNAFRSFIRKLGATMIQKSVWAYPYDCTTEMQLLAEYFELTPQELRIVVAENIGEDEALRKHFKLQIG